MDEIRLPKHVVSRIEQRWTARLAQILEESDLLSGAFFIRERKLRSSSITASSAAAGGIPAAADFAVVPIVIARALSAAPGTFL